MAFKKTHDLAVKTGEYTDRDGNTKGRYENVGHILRDGDNRMLCLKRTFNPAGVYNPDGRDTVILSMFEVKEEQGSAPPARQQQRQAPAQQVPQDNDDDIPF